MLSLIACLDRNHAIGHQNRLIYHIKEDMARFKELTTAHTIIMGRKTFESLPHGALPRRRNIIVSRTFGHIEGCTVYASLAEALEHETHQEEIFVIGGESIYRQTLPLADKLYLTVVDKATEKADSFFPSIEETEWLLTKKEMRNENGLPFSFLTYERKR